MLITRFYITAYCPVWRVTGWLKFGGLPHWSRPWANSSVVISFLVSSFTNQTVQSRTACYLYCVWDHMLSSLRYISRNLHFTWKYEPIFVCENFENCEPRETDKYQRQILEDNFASIGCHCLWWKLWNRPFSYYIHLIRWFNIIYRFSQA